MEIVQTKNPFEKKQKCRLLTEEEQDQLVEMYAEMGPTLHQAAARLKVSVTSVRATLKAFPELQQRVNDVKAEHVESVERELIRLACGAEKSIKKIWIAITDRAGKPILDAEGKQKMRLSRVEETYHPPQVDAIVFFLRAHKPEQYGHRMAPDTGYLPPDASPEELMATIRRKLDEATLARRVV